MSLLVLGCHMTCFLAGEVVRFLTGLSTEHILSDGPSSRQLKNGAVPVEMGENKLTSSWIVKTKTLGVRPFPKPRRY